MLTHTCYSYTSSIASPLHITPGSDGVFVDDSIWSHVLRGVAGFSHIAVTDDEIPPHASDVVHLHTVNNVGINISQIQGKWRHPRKSAGIPFKVTDPS